jgi:hypothetical protein
VLKILDTCGIEICPSSGLLLINTAVIDDDNTTIKTDRHGRGSIERTGYLFFQSPFSAKHSRF